MSPRVSVVIPAYQNVDFVDATIESVLAQTFDDFELVVSDHSSTDGTWEAVARFTSDPRVRAFRTPSGGGAPRNWNRVSDEARGELVKLVCADDLLARDCLERQVEALDTHPSAVLVSSRRRLVDATGGTVIRARGLPGLSGLVDGRAAVRAAVRAGSNIFGEPACVMLRRDALESVGGWDGRFPYLIDQTTYARVLLQGDAVAQPEPLASFRLSSAQWSVDLARQQAAQARAFHHWVAAEAPGLLSRADLAVGDARAGAMAVGRRMAYLWLRRRMTVEPSMATTPT